MKYFDYCLPRYHRAFQNGNRNVKFLVEVKLAIFVATSPNRGESDFSGILIGKISRLWLTISKSGLLIPQLTIFFYWDKILNHKDSCNALYIIIIPPSHGVLGCSGCDHMFFNANPESYLAIALMTSLNPVHLHNLWFFSRKPVASQGCRFVPENHVRKQSATDGVSTPDLNIGDSPGFGGLDFMGQIYNPASEQRFYTCHTRKTQPSKPKVRSWLPSLELFRYTPEN